MHYNAIWTLVSKYRDARRYSTIVLSECGQDKSIKSKL